MLASSTVWLPPAVARQRAGTGHDGPGEDVEGAGTDGRVVAYQRDPAGAADVEVAEQCEEGAIGAAAAHPHHRRAAAAPDDAVTIDEQSAVSADADQAITAAGRADDKAAPVLLAVSASGMATPIAASPPSSINRAPSPESPTIRVLEDAEALATSKLARRRG